MTGRHTWGGATSWVVRPTITSCTFSRPDWVNFGWLSLHCACQSLTDSALKVCSRKYFGWRNSLTPSQSQGGRGGEKGKVLWRFQWFSQQMWGVFWYLRAHGGCFLLEKLKSMGCKLCLKVFTFFNLGTSPSTSEVQLHWDAQPQRREVVREQKVASGLLHCWWCCVSTEGSKTGFPCWMLPSLAPLVASPCTCVQYQVNTHQTTQRSCRDRDRKF